MAGFSFKSRTYALPGTQCGYSELGDLSVTDNDFPLLLMLVFFCYALYLLGIWFDFISFICCQLLSEVKIML